MTDTTSMQIDRYLTLYLFGPLTSNRRRNARHLPILMYHSLSADPESKLGNYYRVCTTPETFSAHMDCLAANGYQGVSLAEGLEWVTHERAEESTASMSGKNSIQPVALTFDDGFRDNLLALPILQRHRFSATIYLPTAYIGEPNARRVFKSKECLTWDEVRTLHKAGVEFGSHTVTHPKLLKLCAQEVDRELRESKHTIEDHLGAGISAFAYPYAFPQLNRTFVAKLCLALQGIGYASCVTTGVGRADARTNPYLLPRLPVNSGDDEALLLAKLRGGYDWLAKPQSLSKRLAAFSRQMSSSS